MNVQRRNRAHTSVRILLVVLRAPVLPVYFCIRTALPVYVTSGGVDNVIRKTLENSEAYRIE